MIKVSKNPYKSITFLLVTITIIFGILLAPSLVSNTFTFNIEYYRDGNIYSKNKYAVMSNKDLKEKNDTYFFSDVKMGNYKIIIQDNSSPYNPIILDYNNCMGYDLKPVSIKMKIVIETYSNSSNVNVNIYDMITAESRYAEIICNDNNEYVYKWSNA